MAVEIYGPVPDTFATDEELEDAIDVVEAQIVSVNTTLDARIDVLEGITGTGVYIHIQDSPVAVWAIAHNLGYYPNVTTVDSLDREVEGDVRYISNNNLEVTFSASFSGKAYLS